MNTAPTATAQVYQALQGRIVGGKLAGGTRLVERNLCEEFGVSRAVVRESLIRLAGCALVDVIPDAGATVNDVSESRIMDAYAFREAIESAAAEQCATRMNREQAEALVETAERFEAGYEAQRRGRPHGLGGLEDEFHGAIIRGSGNEFLRRGWEIARMHLYRGIQGHPDVTLSGEARVATVDDHLAIARAIRQGDAARAGRAMKEHIQRGRSLLLQRLRAPVSKPNPKPRKP